MPNISRGERIAGLLVYLAGPGRANEHTDPHLVAGDPAVLAWHDDAELDRDAALAIAGQLDLPRRALGTDVPGGSVWHCSLSIRAEEGQLTDERWAAIATDFVDGMGFTDTHSESPTDVDTAAGKTGGKAPCRWVAVRHGLSAAGNDHIHLAVSLVREDGTKASIWNDRPKAQTLAGDLERKHGLEVLESRAAGRGSRGVKAAELAKTGRAGDAEPARLSLARAVRGCAAASADEAEFVRRLRRAGVLARPRYAADRDDVVTGFSVAQRPAAAGQRPVWYGGGQLARDLTLPRLRAGWPDEPQAATAAAAEWTAAKRNRRVVAAGRETVEPDPELWQRYAREVRSLRESLTAVDPADRAGWARVARSTAGAFAAWSTAIEATPGPLAAAADSLAASAQLRARDEPPPATRGPSVQGATMLLASAVRGGKGTVGQAVLLRQLAQTALAVRDAHAAVAEARRAAELHAAVNVGLVQVRDRLPTPALPPAPPAVPAAATAPDRPAGVDEQTAEAARLGQASRLPRPPGSPVPNPVNPTPPPAYRTTPPPSRDRDFER